jgi:hypothetical protein
MAVITQVVLVHVFWVGGVVLGVLLGVGVGVTEAVLLGVGVGVLL